MPSDTRRGVAMAGSTFAATLILISGVFHVLMGLEAIIRSAFFLRATSYLFRLSLTAWGWIHLGLGVLLVACAVFLFARAPWAAMVGIVLAVLSIVDNFLFLPFYPVWALLNIAIGVFVLWALATTMAASAGMHRAAARADDSSRWPSANPPAASTDRASRSAAADAPATPEAPAAPPSPATPAARPESAPEVAAESAADTGIGAAKSGDGAG